METTQFVENNFKIKHKLNVSLPPFHLVSEHGSLITEEGLYRGKIW